MRPPKPIDVAHLQRTLIEQGLSARSLLEFRRGALLALRATIPHDAAIFHALSPRVPLDTAALHGIELPRLASSQNTWDDLAVELEPLRNIANRELVASLEVAFTPGSQSHKRVVGRLHALLGMRSLCIAHLIVREHVGSAVVLLRKRANAFDEAALDALRRAAPLLALADRLQERLDDAPRASLAVHLRCVDERLTARQREIVERVALGHSNEQIAEGLGVSANTVRNHLARVFARVGCSNRAELVRLAVLSSNG